MENKVYKLVKNGLLKIISSSVFISLILGVASYFIVFKNIFPRYKVEIVNKFHKNDFKQYFVDLDHDNNSEYVQLGYNNSKVTIPSYIRIYQDYLNNEGTIHSQTNFRSKYVRNSDVVFEDIDGDGIDEIFVFVVKDSKLYLLGYKYLPKVHKDLERIFDYKYISKVNFNKGSEDFSISNCLAADLNNDGSKELIFNVVGLFSAKPRGVFAFDILNDTVYSNQKYPISASELSINHLKSSNKFLILPHIIGSPCNMKDSTAFYNDWSAYVLGYSNNLETFFTPKKFGKGYNNYTYNLYYQNDSIEGILSLYNSDKKISKLFLFNLSGDTIYSKTLSSNIYSIYQTNNEKYSCFYIIGQEIYFLDKEFKIAAHKKLSNYSGLPYAIIAKNIDNDIDDEYLVLNNFGRTYQILDDDFSEMFILPIEKDIGSVVFQKIKTSYKENYIFIGDDGTKMIIKYSKNTYFYLSYISSLVVSLILLFLINLGFKQRLKIVEQHNQQEKDLIESQLKIANKQLSPHFQLNILNSISYLFEKDKDKAQYYMGKYSRLVTETMMNVDKLETTIDNEIQFTKNYLILEQLRLNNKFDFDFEIDENINLELKIPRMAIFTFCENAVKHGLFHLKQKGNLLVKLLRISNNEIKIIIEDNGIGRKKSNELNTKGTGMGIKTLEHIFSHFEKFKKTKIKYNLNDKPNNEGLIVEISIVFNVAK